MDRSSGFPATGTAHDLATSTVPSAKRHTTEPSDHNETLAEAHLSGAATIPRPVVGSGHKNKPPIEGGPIVAGPVAKVPKPPPHVKTPKPPPTVPPPTTPPPIHIPVDPPIVRPGPQGPPGPAGSPGAAATSQPELLFFAGNVPGSDPNATDQNANDGSNTQSQGANPLAIVGILAVIGVGVYFYMQHEKGSHGGASHDRRKDDHKSEEKKAE